MEGAKAYCKRRGSCEQEVTDGIADAVDSGLVPTAMQAFIEGSASSETKRRRKRGDSVLYTKLTSSILRTKSVCPTMSG